MVIQSNPSDEMLVQLVQKGDTLAFSTLYERYLPVVFKRVRYRIPEQDVEDVTQEIFIQAMKSIHGFRGEARFHTWMRTLVQRHIAEYYRRRKPTDPYLAVDEIETENEHDSSFSIRSNPEEADDCILVREALRKLPERYQEILLLRFAEGMPFKDIAYLQGQSLEATKSLFRRAIAAIQKHLEEDYG